MNGAKLFFYYGVMSSSKTAQALMVKHNYEELGKKALLVKPSVDTRTPLDIVKSRAGIESKCITIDELMSYLEGNLDKILINSVVIVDEAQFLTREQVIALTHIVDDLNIPVMCYGLKTDSNGRLFDGSYMLLVMADKIEEIKTVCWCGRKATFTARFNSKGEIIRDSKQIEIGGNDRYRALCRKHYLAGDLGIEEVEDTNTEKEQILEGLNDLKDLIDKIIADAPKYSEEINRVASQVKKEAPQKIKVAKEVASERLAETIAEAMFICKEVKDTVQKDLKEYKDTKKKEK